MHLQKTLITQGNFLFRYRSYFPIILFILAVPFIHSSKEMICCESYIVNILSVFVCAFGFFIRAYAIGTTPKGTSGRNTKQQVAEQLNTKGIYSIVRHPLYLGNFLMWLGIVIFTHSFVFVLLFALLFWIYYERIMIAEEDFIQNKFPEEFIKWVEKTPPFFPSFKHYKKSPISFSLKTVLRREYSGFLAVVLSYTYIDYLRAFINDLEINVCRLSFFILLISIVITLVLRSLKHYTSLLNEVDRS